MMVDPPRTASQGAQLSRYPHLSFALDPAIRSTFENVEPDWGFPAGGGNSLGEITYLRTYSRVMADGRKETWADTCERVISGMFSILKDHCLAHRTPWDEETAQDSAAEAFWRMFSFRWLPPGRGIWMMGTEFVAEEGSAALQNCAFLTTGNTSSDPALPYARLMEMSMLGVGVGFDVRGAGELNIKLPIATHPHKIEDSREGWVDSLYELLHAYLSGGSLPIFDYSKIRPAGTPIKRFGGTAAGPEPLQDLHNRIQVLLDERAGSPIDSRTITDIFNLIGRCVVAGNVRRSAEIALGFPDDKDFVNLKRYDLPQNAERAAWGWLSNNTVIASATEHLDREITEAIAYNGEPGLFFLDLAQSHGRLTDPEDDKDYRALGCNPCAEQTLEDHECCTLVETFPTRCEDLSDYLRTLKFAYLYAKAVTLLPTHWPETNEVMTRNRRIGASMSGLAQFVENRGWNDLREWMSDGYTEIQEWDRIYSEWLGVRESIKTTSIKPSGTVSLLAGVTPGVHWPTHTNYFRRIRFRHDDPMVQVLEAAGYPSEEDDHDPSTRVVTFAVLGPDTRAQDDVTVWEKAKLAALAQGFWADNMVSATFSFRADERDQIAPLIESFTGSLKTMSFLPPQDGDGGTYRQAPYEAISESTYEGFASQVRRADFSTIYAGDALDAAGEAGCSTDACEIRSYR